MTFIDVGLAISTAIARRTNTIPAKTVASVLAWIQTDNTTKTWNHVLREYDHCNKNHVAHVAVAHFVVRDSSLPAMSCKIRMRTEVFTSSISILT